ncbi:MAG: MMPL family transporter, partial [bacterium]|nr:MMPL family transporter [bacterium]
MKIILKIYRLGLRFPRTVFILSLLATLLAFGAAKNLRIENNLSTLLPKSFESVQALQAMEESFGGLGFLVLAVEGEDPKKTVEFSDLFVDEIEGLPGVQYVDYRRPIDFFKERQWLYFDMEDLHEMESRLDRSLELQKFGVSPYFSDLMDFADPEDNPDLTYEDIRKKYEEKQGFNFGSESAERTISDEGKFIAFRVKTKAHQQNLEAGEAVIAEISQIRDRLLKKPQFSNIKVSFSGDHVSAIDTVNFLRKRMATVSFVVIALLILVLWAYMRRFSAVFLVGFPLLSGIIWTGGLIYLLLDHLNIITGFAAGILAGLGSDYGIYIVTRFFQERGTGKTFEEACDFAFQNTGRASYSSMLTTVFAFLALVFSEFGVTVEFGIVGALGLFMNYLAMMIILPSILALREKFLEKREGKNRKDSALGDLHGELEKSKIFRGLFYPRAPLVTLCLVLVLVVISGFAIPSRSKIHFDDGRLDPLGLPGEKLYEKVADLYGGTLQPTLLLVKGWENGEKVVASFEKEIDAATDGSKLTYKNVVGLSSFVPKGQKEKKEILARLAQKFKKSKFPVESKRLELIDSFNQSVNVNEVTLDDIPEEVTRFFVSPYQEDALAVFLFPQWDELNWEWMRRYSKAVYQVRQDQKLEFQAVDNPFVATEFVEMMEREGPKMLGMTLLFLLLMLLWVVRPVTRALIIFGHLVMGLILLAGTMWIFKIDINTLNIAAFPIILGTGIDCFIHFGLRYDETGNMVETVYNKLPTIMISNLTTIIGFGGLV